MVELLLSVEWNDTAIISIDMINVSVTRCLNIFLIWKNCIGQLFLIIM